MQQYGNTTTFNIEKVLYQNAIDSLYFKNNCVKLSTFEELVDEVGDRAFAPALLPVIRIACTSGTHALHLWPLHLYTLTRLHTLNCVVQMQQ
jgi:PRP38 family